MKTMLYLIFAFFVVGCSVSHTAMSHPQVTSELVFISEMIPHHQDAINSSMRMLTSEDPEIRNLAKAIISAQEAEVSMMQSWINEWYAEEAYAITYTPMMSSLQETPSRERDILFLTEMVEHHEAAIQMAKQASSLDTLRPEVLLLIDAIINTQSSEIDWMNKKIRELS